MASGPFFWCGLECKAWRKDVRRAANLERVRASTGLSNPRHMTALADGRLCLLQADGRIKIFPADGRFSQPPKVVAIPGTDGVHATGLVHKTVGGTEHFYVTFDSHLVGRFLMHRFLPRATPVGDAVGGYGSGEREFKGAEALHLGMAGGTEYLYVADYGNHRIQALEPETLNFCFAFGRHGRDPGELMGPSGLASLGHKFFVAAGRYVHVFDMADVRPPPAAAAKGQQWVQAARGSTPVWGTASSRCTPMLGWRRGYRAHCEQGVGPRLVDRVQCDSEAIGLAAAHGRLYVAQYNQVLCFGVTSGRRYTSLKHCTDPHTGIGRVWGVCADAKHLRLYATAGDSLVVFYKRRDEMEQLEPRVS